jgi:hypothetical protein
LLLFVVFCCCFLLLLLLLLRLFVAGVTVALVLQNHSYILPRTNS